MSWQDGKICFCEFKKIKGLSKMCVCGHGLGRHDEDLGHEIWCQGNECGCEDFRPSNLKEAQKSKKAGTVALKIMSSFERGKALGGIVRFEGMTIAAVRCLVAAGALRLDGRKNDSPTVGNFLKMTDRVLGMSFHGFRTAPPRKGLEVVIEGFHISSKWASANTREKIKAMKPDEVDEQKGFIRTWWD